MAWVRSSPPVCLRVDVRVCPWLGIIDICHRMLFGTPGTMANVPMLNPANAVSHRLHHSIVSDGDRRRRMQSLPIQSTNDPTDPSQNLSLLQYVNSKFPHHQLNRDNPNNAASTQALQKYFTSQQNQLQPKYEVRTARNVHIFDEKLGNMVSKAIHAPPPPLSSENERTI